MRKVKIALLIGSGSRVRGILKCAHGIECAEVVFVISSKGEGVGTKLARSRGIRAEVLRLKDFGTGEEARERLSAVVSAILRGRKVDLVVMAGWRVLMPPSFVGEFGLRTVNIHPSILPSYPGDGEKAIKAQWEARWHRDAPPAGCTLHYVDEGMDTGEPILKGIVYPRDYRSLEEFAKAIHKKEDEVLCEGIKKLVKKQL
jgi:phosphoribosylglycinamide formyltransferase-1